VVALALAPEIALHEMGHSFAGLADEYVDNSLPAVDVVDFIEGNFPNVSTKQDPSLVPWHAWIDMENSIPSLPEEPGVGVFTGGFYKSEGYYRPTHDSRMRTFDQPFGPVNGEAWALAVYRKASAVAFFAPRDSALTIDANKVSSFIIEPLLGTDVQRVVWTLNGRLLSQDINTRELHLILPAGNHELTVGVSDFTGHIRQPLPNDAHFEWRWEINAQ